MASVTGYFNYAYYFTKLDYSVYQIVFYLTIAIISVWVLLMIISLMFILNQKIAGSMLFVILRVLSLGFMYVLLLPTLYTLVIPLTCTSGMFHYFPTQQCWGGLQVIDQIIAIIMLPVYIVFMLTLKSFYFQGMYDIQRVCSRRNGRCLLLYTAHMVVVVLLTLLPQTQNCRIFYEVYQLVGSVICFLYCKHNDTFNHRWMQKMVLTIMTVDMWTSLMLCVAELVEGRIMIGSLYTWLFCLPLVLVIQGLQQQEREKCLMIYVNKFKSPEQLVNHIHEVVKLVDMDRKRLPQGQLLNGYIEFHNQTCPNPLCPLKKVKFSLAMYKAKNEIVQKTDKRHALVFETLSRLFILGMAKFPQNVLIRIEFAMYTLRILKSKPQALEELNKLDKFKKTIHEKYVIFYIKSTVETEISELSGEGQDFTEQRDFDEKFGLFKAGMERSVSLLMEFWSQFADEKPDLIKLYEIGSKLFPIKQYVESTWKRLQRIQNQSLPGALRLYSKYLIEIFNDRVAGFDYIEKARKIENQFSQRKEFKLGMSSNLNIDGQEDGCAFLSLEEDRFGQIYAVNMSAASFFGYDKTEILNKKVNNIMPLLYARYHDDFLKRFIDTNEATLLNKERQLLSKNKNGYLYPIQVLLRPVYHVLKEGVEFVATLKKDKKIKDVGYIVCNKDLLIEDMSSTCFNLLGIDLKALQQQPIHAQDLFLDVIDNFDEYKQKSGKIVDYTFPKHQDDHLEFHSGDQVAKLIVQVTEICFLIMKSNPNDSGLAGYQIKIERVADLQFSTIQYPMKKGTNFQFRPNYTPNGMIFMGEQSDANYSEMVTHIQDMSFLNTEFDQKKEVLSTSGMAVTEDYSVGIRTLRLFDGQLMDIEKFLSEGDVESFEEVQIKKEEAMLENEDGVQEKGYFRSSKELQETLNGQSESRTIRWLNYSSLFLIVVLIIIAIMDNVFQRMEISSQKSSWQLIIHESDMVMQIMLITSLSRELILTNIGMTYSSSADLVNNLTAAIAQFGNLSTIVFQDISGSQNVRMFTSTLSYSTSVLEQATQQLISKALNIQKANSTFITATQIDYFYVYYNSLNDYINQLLKQYIITVQNSYDNTDNLQSQLLAILILSACITVIASLLLACVLTSTLDKRQEILSIFLDIPEKTAKLFYTKCENFLQQISSNDEDEVNSEIDFIEEKNPEESVSLLGRKKKRFKNNENKHIGFFMKMLFLGMIIESYYIMIYFLNYNNVNGKLNMLQEFNQTSISASYYAITVNALKQFIFDQSITILNSDPNTTVYNFINQTYLIDTEYQRLHAIDIDYNDVAYVNYYNSIMFGNFCSVTTDTTCTTFSNGILTHGLMTAVSLHYQNIRLLYNQYWLVTNTLEKFPWPGYVVQNFTSNRTQNLWYNILNVPESIAINQMQYTYMLEGYSLLKNKYLHVVNTDQDNFIVQQLILLIFYLIILLMATLICWNPFLRSLNREIWSTKCLLTFIPIDEIAKIKSINNYIKTVILEQDL